MTDYSQYLQEGFNLPHDVVELPSRGKFYKNKKQGRGLYTFPDGVKYLGSFYDDLRHGSGRFVYQDGSSMEVDCVKDSCTEK